MVATVRGLELDETQTGGRDHRLELGVHPQLFDHVGHVPLDRMGCDSQEPGERLRVVAVRQQPKHVQLARGELCQQPFASFRVGRMGGWLDAK